METSGYLHEKYSKNNCHKSLYVRGGKFSQKITIFYILRMHVMCECVYSSIQLHAWNNYY